MGQLTLDQGRKRLVVKNLQIDSEFAFEFFNKLPVEQRDEKFLRALQIGIYALKENRISAFLAKTTNELGTELESLKIMYDMKAELFARSSGKGTLGEADIAEYLTQEHKNDRIELTGNAPGAMKKNKTGDILCHIDGLEEKRVVIECKFDKSMRLGSIEDQDWYGSKLDTALGQLVEAKANRECTQAIIVFDSETINPSLEKRIQKITYEPAYGFLVIVDSQRGDYTNLGLAYSIARELACADRKVEMETDLLTVLLDRIIHEAKELGAVQNLVETNINNSNEILRHLSKGSLSLEFCRSYLSKFLNEGTLSKADLHDFYTGGDRREKFKDMQLQIEDMISGKTL